MRSLAVVAVVLASLGCGSSAFELPAGADSGTDSAAATDTSIGVDALPDVPPLPGEIGPTPDDALPIDAGITDCVDGTLGAHSYRACRSSGNWNQARLKCSGFPGFQLISIESAEEQDYADRLLNGRGVAWIGLSDQKVEGQFVWASGAPLGYSNWAPDEPTAPDDGDCVSMFESGLWYSFDCSSGFQYIICEST